MTHNRDIHFYHISKPGRYFKFACIIAFCVLAISLNGCARRRRTITRISTKEPTHRVEAGDTIWSIADRYNIKPAELQSRNRISDPRTLKPGSVLIIPVAGRAQAEDAESRKVASAGTKPPAAEMHAPEVNPMFAGDVDDDDSADDPRVPAIIFAMPAQGDIIRPFGTTIEGVKLEGVLIKTDSKAAIIRAAADGQVVFSGELEGYGQLIILDHKNGYYTVYAKLSRLSVNLSDSVSSGDGLGRAGAITDAHHGVHFEVRHHDIPVNPSAFMN